MSTPPHEAELEEILHLVWDHTWDSASKDSTKKAPEVMIEAKAAINAYCYQQVMELLTDPPESFDLVHSRVDTINHLNRLRQAAAERFNQ